VASQRAIASLALLGALAGVATSRAGDPLPEDTALSALGFEIFLALLALGGAALSPAPLGERLGLRRGRLASGSLAALIMGTVALSAALDSTLDVTGWRERSALPEFDAQLAGARGRSLQLALLAFGVVPGVAEELLCRGLIQRGLEARVGPAAAIAATALLFGALHIDPVHAVSAAVLGLYLGVVCWLAASVRAAIACHVVNNLVAVVSVAYGIGAPAALAIPLGSLTAGAALAWVWRRGGPPMPGAFAAPGARSADRRRDYSPGETRAEERGDPSANH
jgi:membrane protease YdiL (CAAX protease family)